MGRRQPSFPGSFIVSIDSAAVQVAVCLAARPTFLFTSQQLRAQPIYRISTLAALQFVSGVLQQIDLDVADKKLPQQSLAEGP